MGNPVIFARQNSHGVSVNESAVCKYCLGNEEVEDTSYQWWCDAEDVVQEKDDDNLYPIDNPDGRCNGCGRTTTGTVTH